MFLPVLGLMGAQPAAAKDQHLAPTGEWQAYRAGDSCFVRRSFGSGGRQASIELAGRGGIGYPDVTIWGKGLVALVRRDAQPKLFLGDAAVELPPVRAFKSADLSGVFKARFGFQDAGPAARAASTLRLAGKSEAASFDTGPLAAPMRQLQDCRDAVLRDWGLDPVAQRDAATRAQPANDQTTWITKADLPDLYFDHLRNVVDVTLIVDAQGKATRCISDNAYDDKALETRVCDAVLRHAAFTPGMASHGKPIASYYRFTLNMMVQRP